MTATASTDPVRGGVRAASRLALPAVFAALAAAAGYALVSVPNVELVTFVVYVAGALLGRWRGAVVGAVAMAVFSGANPMGSGLGLPPLFVAQVASAAFAGFAGGATGPTIARAAGLGTARGRRPAVAVAASALVGLALTAVYQAAVVAGLAVASPEFATGLLSALAANAFFSTVHLVSNTVVFAILAPVVLPRAARALASLEGTRGGPAKGADS